MLKLLNIDEHGTYIGAPLLNWVKSLGFDGVRFSIPRNTDATLGLSLYNEIAGAGLTPLVILEDLKPLTYLLPNSQVELYNEPDLGTNQQYSPEDYARHLQTAAPAAFARGIDLWAPVASNLNQRGFDFLQRVYDLTHDLPYYVSMHRYPTGNAFDAPHDGFASREAETAKLLSIIGNRRWMISEFGYHTAPRPRKTGRITWPIWFFPWRWSEEEKADLVKQEIRWWRQQGAWACNLYNINSGPDPDHTEDNFGIRDVNGNPLPVASVIKTA